MNRKSIVKVIKQKISNWMLSIDDAGLVKDIESSVIVTGGCISSMLMGEKINDYDVYFDNKETAKKVAEYYCKKFNERNSGVQNKLGYHNHAFVLDGKDVEAYNNGEKELEEFAPGYENQGELLSRMIANCGPDRIKVIVRSDGVAVETGNEEILSQPFEDVNEVLDQADQIPAEDLEEGEKFRPVFLSTNAITLSGKIQVVVRFYGNPEEIHKNYDFVHCMNYWTYKDGLCLNSESLEAILSRELIYRGSKYPLCSIIRTRKFINRGFHINAGQYLKMCFQLSQLDLSNVDVLEDQLIGVDSAYFNILIDALKNKMKTEPNFKIEGDYVASIVDKIF